MKMKLGIISFLTIGQLAFASDLGGDDFDMSLEDLLNITISTASKKAEDINEAPATIYVVTQKEINERGYVNLNDVLRDLPGMQTVDNYFSEIGTQAIIRGVQGNNKIILLINGVRANPAGSESLPIRSDISVRMARQIEVVYGPGSTLYGQDAISAVINIITDKELKDSERSVTVKAGVNHMEGYASIRQLLTDDKENPLVLSSYVQYQDATLDKLSENYSDHAGTIATVGGTMEVDTIIGTDTTRVRVGGDVIEGERKDIGFNAMLRLADKNNSVQIWHRESKRSSAEGGFASILYTNDDAIWRDRTTTIEFKNNVELSSMVSMSSMLTYNRYEIDKSSQYVFALGGLSLADFDYKYGTGSSIILEEQFNINPTENVTIISGVSVGQYDITPKATIDKFPGEPDLNSDLATQAGQFRYITTGAVADTVTFPKVNTIRYRQYGFYADVGFKPMESLKLIAGLRIDINSLYEDVPISPRLAAIYKVTPQLAVKYIYTQAYVAPAPYYGYSSFFNGAILQQVNPDLKPEKSISNEINIHYKGKQFVVSSSGYINQQKDLLILGERNQAENVVDPDVIAGSTSSDGTYFNFGNVPLVQTANSGSLLTYGFDAFTKYYVGSASIWGSYSWVNQNVGTLSQIDLEATTLTNVSKHNTRLGVTYAFLSKYTATTSFSWRSTPEATDDQQANIDAKKLTDEVKNPIFVNAHVTYSPIEKLSIFLDAKNLLDSKVALDGIFNPTPQEGIKVTGGASFTF